MSDNAALTGHLPFHSGGSKDPMVAADGSLEMASEAIPFCFVRS